MPDSNVFFPRDGRTLAVSAEGRHITDADGRRYLDAIGGTHVVSIGYGVEEVAEAMAEQARAIPFVHKLAFSTDAQERLARKVADLAPEGMSRVTFVTGGSLGVEMAVQIARHYHMVRGDHARHRIIARWHGYHGRTMTALALSGSLFVKSDAMAVYGPDVIRIQAPHCYRCPFGMAFPGCALHCADELERTIVQHGAHTISAFIAEPIGGGASSGMTPPPGYYERIREICDRHGVLFIAEEVITGFGRTGKPFGIQHWDATPDLIVATKGLSSGYAPIGAVIVHDRIWETMVDADQKGLPAWVTYSGHPVSCAAALAVQDYIERHELVNRCAEMGAFLRARLEELAQRQPIIGDIRGKGLLIGIEFVRDRATRAPFPSTARLVQRIVEAALARGLILRGRQGSGVDREGDHILLSPPFTITRDECVSLVDRLEAAITDVVRGEEPIVEA